MTATVNDVAQLPAEPDRTWWRACASDRVSEDEGLVLGTVPSTAVFAADGEFFCIDDTCTHEDYSLADGWVQGCIVECSLHMAKFDLRTGAPAGPPASRPVATHPVTRVGDDLFVSLPDSYLVREVNGGLA